MQRLCCLSLILYFAITLGTVNAQTDESSPLDSPRRDRQAESRRQGLLDAVQSYADAFNAADLDAMAALWMDDAVYVFSDTDERIEGKESIVARFTEAHELSPGTKMLLVVDGIRFVSPTVATVEGIAETTDAGGVVAVSAYSSIFVRSRSSWQINAVREFPIAAPEPSAASSSAAAKHLAELDWLVGRWIDEGESSSIVTESRWTSNRAFLTLTFQVFVDGEVTLQGSQVIGWDPQQQQIRSWVFDSNGGFGHGNWRSEGDRWIVEQENTLADGGSGSATHIYTRLDNDRYTFESVQRQIDGEPIPSIDQVTVIRVADDQENQE